MDVISPTFEFVDFLPTIAAFGIGFLMPLIMGIVFAVKDKNAGDIVFGLILGVPIGAVFAALVAVGSLHSHHDNMIHDLEQRFEDGYDLTIVDNSYVADIPLTPGDEAKAVKVFLHEIPGEQSIIVEIVDDKYVVTHNGEVREPRVP